MIIVCPQSPVIHAACIGPYREQETGVYEIKDASFDIVRQMVEYLYTGQYEVPSSQDSDGKKHDAILPLVFHARMFDIADTYLIKGLQSLSVTEFTRSATREPDDCTFLRSIIDVYSLQCESSKILRDVVVESIFSIQSCISQFWVNVLVVDAKSWSQWFPCSAGAKSVVREVRQFWETGITILSEL
ncbi:hypothetical protein E5D57_003567 [Metarhizium anisopliae]|nr:hypothetical protein E5D57_003567 [Metarhizium anisopliae]